MPIHSLQLQAGVQTKINKKIRSLFKSGILHNSKKSARPYTIGFCMHIQIVPKKQIQSLAFGKPEGIRVLIQSENDVIAAADFLFVKKRLKFSYVHHGNGLNILLSSINKLEKKYKDDKNICNVELIYFLLATGPYILIKSKKEKHFYHATAERLGKITPEQMRKQVTNILIHREQTNKIN